jgi:hypothetical protein
VPNLRRANRVRRLSIQQAGTWFRERQSRRGLLHPRAQSHLFSARLSFLFVRNADYGCHAAREPHGLRGYQPRSLTQRPIWPGHFGVNWVVIRVSHRATMRRHGSSRLLSVRPLPVPLRLSENTLGKSSRMSHLYSACVERECGFLASYLSGLDVA